MSRHSRPKTTALVSIGAFVAIAVLAVLLLKDRVAREWLLWRLPSADEAEQVRIASRLSGTQDPRIVAALFRLEPSRWESEFIHDIGGLNAFFEERTKPVESCSPAVFGLRALGGPAIEPLIEELKRVARKLANQTGPVPVRSTYLALFRIVGGLSGIPDAREPLFRLWSTSPDVGERSMAVLVLGFMKHPPAFDESLRRIADSPEAGFLRDELLERLESMK